MKQDEIVFDLMVEIFKETPQAEVFVILFEFESCFKSKNECERLMWFEVDWSNDFNPCN